MTKFAAPFSRARSLYPDRVIIAANADVHLLTINLRPRGAGHIGYTRRAQCTEQPGHILPRIPPGRLVLAGEAMLAED